MNKNNSIGITTAAFAFEMEAHQELKAISWQNKLSGEMLALGGGEPLRPARRSAGAREKTEMTFGMVHQIESGCGSFNRRNGK